MPVAMERLEEVPVRSALDSLIAVLHTPALAGDISRGHPALWAEMKRIAEIHRLAGELAFSTAKWLPAEEQTWRNQVLFRHHRSHARRLVALRRMIEAFGRAGIPCVSLKGPILAERFYPHPWLRPANDLDLLIYERDGEAATALMLRLGFPLERAYPWNVQRQLVHHVNFCATADSPRVEMHYKFEGGGRFIGGAEFMDRAVPWRSASGLDAMVLSPADEAFYVCVHAASHAFHRLRWVYDSVATARALTDAERNAVHELAKRLDTVGGIAATAIAAREFLGERLELGAAFPSPHLFGELTAVQVRRMVERLEGNTTTLAEKAGFRLDLCRMAGSPYRAARQLAHSAALEIRRRMHRQI